VYGIDKWKAKKGKFTAIIFVFIQYYR
jgi:hypothetical protein